MQEKIAKKRRMEKEQKGKDGKGKLKVKLDNLKADSNTSEKDLINSPADNTMEPPNLSKQKSLDSSKKPEVMQRARSHVVSPRANQGRDRDDISISRKSSMIEDPMVTSANQRKDMSLSKFPITRICLTGGPCAGKTTALTELSLHLKQDGYRVLQVPEAATILKNGGAFINTPKMTFSGAVKFQISLMKL